MYVHVCIYLWIYIVTSPFHQSHLNWVHDPAPAQSRRLEIKNTVPRNNTSENEVSAIATRNSPPAPSSSILPKKRRSRRRLARRAANRNSAHSSAAPLTQDAAGPISAQQFQQERRSRFQRTATPHQRGGRQCTRLPGM